MLTNISNLTDISTAPEGDDATVERIAEQIDSTAHHTSSKQQTRN
jgi:hypothetical protein